jgi:hypothetical protein
MIQEEIKGYFLGMEFDNGIYLENPERIVAIGAALYKSYLDRDVKKIQIHIPMHTYLEYEKSKDNFVKLSLDDYKDGILPLEPKPPKTCKVPTDVESVIWKVYQEHTYGADLKREVIETIKFENPDGKAERIRLEYKVNQNGILEKWKPLLIYRQNKKVKTGAARHYDWIAEDPTDISNEYGIRTP